MKEDRLGVALIKAENERLRLELAYFQKYHVSREAGSGSFSQKGVLQRLIIAIKRHNAQLQTENTELLCKLERIRQRVHELETQLSAQKDEITRAYASLRNENGFLRASIHKIAIEIDAHRVSYIHQAKLLLKEIINTDRSPLAINMKLRENNEQLRDILRRLTYAYRNGELRFEDETLNEALEENLFNL